MASSNFNEMVFELKRMCEAGVDFSLFFTVQVSKTKSDYFF